MDLVTSSCAPERDRLAGVLATVGHELRTPLTAVRGYIETLLGADVDAPTARRFLETARRETLRLGRLIDGMLELSLLDDSPPLRHASCDAAEEIAAAVEILAPLAAARGVTIRTRVPKNARALVDGDACVHAVANLLQNAIRHGRAGGTVEVACTSCADVVEILVQDDGAGIAPQYHDAIFRLGFRATSERNGYGIGLAVVRAIAERAGGSVRVEPCSGGARFALRFPAG